MNPFLRCLEYLDVKGMRQLWARHSPHLPQPKNDAATLAAIHRARTESESMTLDARAYSHRWLEDHGLPSGLPDHLRPHADRLYPVTADSVGISVNTASGLFRPIVPYVERAMSEAVLECYADGRKEPEVIKSRMTEARKRTVSALLGIK